MNNEEVKKEPFWTRIKTKIKKAWKWLRKNVINKETLPFFLIAEAIFWSPVIVCGILGLVVDAWYWSISCGIILFWTGPFTPGFELQILLTLLLKRIFGKKKKEDSEEKE